MLMISESCLEALLSMSRVDRITGTLTRTDGIVIDLSEGNIDDGSVSISRECAGAEEIEFGSATMAQLNISLRTEESRYVFYDAKISLVYGICLADGTWYDIPLGEFTVAEADRKNAMVVLTAYDNLLLLDRDYGGAVLYGSPFEILLAICESCGVELGITEEEILAMPNSAELIQIDETSGCRTYRDCAKVVAQMLGAFVIADRSGAVSLRRYSKEKDITIPRRIRNKTTMADYICTYMGIRVISTKGEFLAYDVDQESGLELTIEDAPAWDYGLEETLQARTDALLAELIQLSYTPGDFSMPGLPVLECGDLVELETADGSVTTLITSYKWKYHKAMTVKSTGKNPYLKASVTRKTITMRELQAQTEANKLIFYSFTNSAEVVSKTEDSKQIAQVTFVTTKATSAMFVAQLPLKAVCVDTVDTQTTETERTVTVTNSSGASATITDSAGNPLTLKVLDADTVKTVTPGFVDVQIEYYLEGTLVEYELIQRLPNGSHILGLFYAFDALDGNQTLVWQVKIKVVGGNGTVTVPKNAFRATITGQGLAGTQKWDGTLTFDDAVPPISLRSSLKLRPLAEDVTAETQIPTPASIEQRMAPLSLRTGLTLGGLTERVSATEIREKKTIDTAEWDYSDRYVEIDGSNIMAREEWTYQSEEQSIDSGRVTVTKAITNDLASVEEVTVDG